MVALLRVLVLGSLSALAWVIWGRFDDTLDATHRAEAQVLQLQSALSSVTAARDEALARAQVLATAMRHLKVDTRRARLSVLSQHTDVGGQLTSQVAFQELDAQGEPLGEAVQAELTGKLAYVEALVIKFDDQLVEAGDPWRGASLCLFRRLFSETQRPEQGVLLDPPGQEPVGYADDDHQPADALWRNFWELADDPEAAAARGVRALHGEAPFVELRDGRRYLVELRASGGLTIRREP